MINGWLWVELWTVNANDAGTFYAWLLGYNTKRLTVAGQDYTMFRRDSLPIAGLLEMPVRTCAQLAADDPGGGRERDDRTGGIAGWPGDHGAAG
jgi:predicted enzyme related to lactoylglutathione lyase